MMYACHKFTAVLCRQLDSTPSIQKDSTPMLLINMLLVATSNMHMLLNSDMVYPASKQTEQRSAMELNMLPAATASAVVKQGPLQ